MSPQRSADAEPEAVADLREAAEAYREAEAAVEEHGRETLSELEDAYSNAHGLLLEYEDKATDTGLEEFVNFANFKGSFVASVEALDEDLPAREAFEAARDAVDKRRLDERDFERAREALAPAREVAGRLDDLEEARSRLLQARERAEQRRTELREEIEECQRLLGLGEADLDAPVSELRAPIERWNGAVREGFEELRTEASAREAFALLDRAERYPLVDLPSPPERLAEFVETAPAGEEPIATLREYAGYSRSKLSHYVEDADRLKRAVAPEQTFLESLSAAPLAVDWPPPRAELVPWLARELRAVAGSIAGDEGVAALRELEAVARDRDRYRRLRQAAVADAELDPSDRKRVESGAVEREIESLRAAIDRIDEALADAPDP